MGERAPIYRLAEWFTRRQALCVVCREKPRADARYCSEECAEAAAEEQAYGM